MLAHVNTLVWTLSDRRGRVIVIATLKPPKRSRHLALEDRRRREHLHRPVFDC